MATKAQPIRIRTDQRILIIGGTGDGKTTLAMKILANLRKHGKQKLVVLNPGAEPKLYEYFGQPKTHIDESWPDEQHIKTLVTKDRDKFGIYFWPIIKKGNVLLYIDELFTLGTGSQYNLGLQYIYQAGRRRNIGVVAVTQRPQGIPTFTRNQSDHFFVGNVMDRDLKVIEDATSQEWRHLIKERKQYEFLYWSRHEQGPPRIVKF